MLATGAALAAAVLGAAAPAAADTNVWTAVGPSGGLGLTVVVDPVDPRVVYAGTQGGIFKSTSGGTSWQLASRGMKAHEAVALAVDPLRHRTVYAAAGGVDTADSGVWVSRDGAATWQTAFVLHNNGRAFTRKEFVASVAVDPALPGTVYAASNYHLFVSHDTGATWTVARDFSAIDPDWGLIVRLAADPARSSVFALAASNFFDAHLYFKLFESSDGGATWQDRSAPLPDGNSFSVLGLTIEPARPGTLYLAGSAVFRSLDGGASWQRADGPSWPGGDSFAPPLAAGPHGVVIVGNTDFPGIFKSLDRGATWARIADPPLDTFYYLVQGFAVGPSPEQFFAAVDTLGVVASADGGATWQMSNAGLRSMPAYAVAIDPQDSRTILTAGDQDLEFARPGLFRSSTAGDPWTPMGPPALLPASLWRGSEIFDPVSLFVDPADPGHLLYGNG